MFGAQGCSFKACFLPPPPCRGGDELREDRESCGVHNLVLKSSLGFYENRGTLIK